MLQQRTQPLIGTTLCLLMATVLLSYFCDLGSCRIPKTQVTLAAKFLALPANAQRLNDEAYEGRDATWWYLFKIDASDIASTRAHLNKIAHPSTIADLSRNWPPAHHPAWWNPATLPDPEVFTFSNLTYAVLSPKTARLFYVRSDF